jgi:hypothetical protein
LAYNGALYVAYVPAHGFFEGVAASLWDGLIQGPGQERVLNWLRLVDPRIEDLDYIAGKSTARIALLKVENEGRIPLNSMGDGLRRMFILVWQWPRHPKAYCLTNSRTAFIGAFSESFGLLLARPHRNLRTDICRDPQPGLDRRLRIGK